MFERYLKQASGIDVFSASAQDQLQQLEKSVRTQPPVVNESKKRDRTAAISHFKKAISNHRNGNIEEAIHEYILATETDNSYERAYYNLGLAYYASEQMFLAEESLIKALRLSPTSVDTRYNLALVNHYHLKRTQEALRQLKKIISQQPNYQPAIDLLEWIENK